MKTAMIFAAGLGTRLKPLTDNMPKALVPVCGKPLVRIVLDKLVSAGYDDIVVNVHHFASMITDYLSSCSYSGVRIRVSDETDLLRETGGGIRHARSLLENSGHFLIHNVDIISNLDLSSIGKCIPEGALAALVVSERETSRYLLFDDGMRLAGWTNISTGEVKSPYGRIDPDKYHKYAFSGIHSMSSDVFKVFDDEGFGERFPIMDFYLKVADRYPIYAIKPQNLRLIDVGKLNSLDKAEELFLSFGH